MSEKSWRLLSTVKIGKGWGGLLSKAMKFTPAGGLMSAVKGIAGSKAFKNIASKGFKALKGGIAGGGLMGALASRARGLASRARGGFGNIMNKLRNSKLGQGRAIVGERNEKIAHSPLQQ